MTLGSMLTMTDFTQTFFIECDAFGTGVGAFLMQSNRPIAFFNESLAEDGGWGKLA